ncbi:MAG TPA: ABC transporter permease [Bacteroidales bacterium]|nr:ABC transporter permease [Bacteroidales bacterium]HOX77462.1 ABC transporter permease [Bacteroidales bacterium]HPI84792.1 ABC transporter permease [Bacteroidales bacterium]HPM91983.1 ABC transporter permease [Bacteroidales bacterium]
MIIFIAWRNIWRNKLRSLVVILAVCLGLFGTLLMMAISNGMVEQKIDASIHNEISHIQVHHPDYLQEPSLSYSIDSANAIARELKAISGVKAVSGKIKAMAMASTAATAAGVTINGIDPEQENTVTQIHKYIIEGDYFETKSNSAPVVISKKLCEKLKAKLHSKIIVTIQHTSGEIAYGLFRVTGIYKTANNLFDEPNIFVKKEDLAELTGFDTGKVSEFTILLDESELTDPVSDAVKQKLPGLSVMSWKEIEPLLVAMSAMMDQFGYFLLIIILIAMAFGIINTMTMAVLERTRELGMLMAVGMNRRKIFLMIMTETIYLSLVGTFFGIIISAVTIHFTGMSGINFSAWTEGYESLGYSALVYPSLYLDFYVGMTIMVIITAIISSIYPARKALKLNPASAIREDA